MHDEIKVILNGQSVLMKTVVSKSVKRELRDRIITPPTAQLNFNARFINDVLEWKEIYALPFRVALDTKLREFQYKLLNRCLVTNILLYEINVVQSQACSLCGEIDESVEHFFVSSHLRYPRGILTGTHQMTSSIKNSAPFLTWLLIN